MNDTKKCKICLKELFSSDFSIKKFPNGEYRLNTCKQCIKNNNAKHKRDKYKENPETIKNSNRKYYKLNKDKIINNAMAYYLNHKEDIIQKNSSYAKKNRIKIREYERNRRIYKKDHINSIKSSYDKNKRATNPQYKIRKNISRLINLQIKNNGDVKSNKSILQYLQYSILELKEHLEKQFDLWMNWNNYGSYHIQKWDDTDQKTWTWQIDHIIPQSKLPYTSMEDENFKKCWALDNLRPLSSKQNLIDGNKR